jgi:hypothetical protein
MYHFTNVEIFSNPENFGYSISPILELLIGVQGEALKFCFENDETCINKL